MKRILLTNSCSVMALALVTFAAGCSGGEPASIGENTKTGEKLSDYAATWDGYVEAYTFFSGSERVRLTLDENGQGYLELGEGPEPLTNPDIGYPPMLREEFYEHDSTEWQRHFSSPIEGFRFSVEDAEISDKRLRVGYQAREPYIAWCAAQVPYLYPTREPPYICIARGLVEGDYEPPPETACDITDPEHTEEETVVDQLDCSRIMVCASPTCMCDEDSCELEPQQFVRATLDGSLEADGNTLIGTLLLTKSVDHVWTAGGANLELERVTIRLERQ